MITRCSRIIFLLLSICLLLACSKPSTPTEVTVEVEVTRLIKVEEIVEVEKEVTRQVPIVVTQVTIPTQTPTPEFMPSYPISTREAINNIDCGNPRNQIEINECAYARAHNSARELDAFLLELEQQYPNGAWQTSMIVGSAFMGQQEWESHKESYCEIEIQGSYGGSAHTLYYFDCIEQVNFSRLGLLKYLACRYLDNFEWTCDE